MSECVQPGRIHEAWDLLNKMILSEELHENVSCLYNLCELFWKCLNTSVDIVFKCIQINVDVACISSLSKNTIYVEALLCPSVLLTSFINFVVRFLSPPPPNKYS